MDIIYRRKQATAAEVQGDLPDPPGYSAVRTLLRILEEKGHLRHTKDGPRYVYLPKRQRERAGRSALKRAVQTFFGGSLEKAVAALLDVSDADISDEQLDRIAGMIRQTRKGGKQS